MYLLVERRFEWFDIDDELGTIYSLAHVGAYSTIKKASEEAEAYIREIGAPSVMANLRIYEIEPDAPMKEVTLNWKTNGENNEDVDWEDVP